jgi:hypothetical protein
VGNVGYTGDRGSQPHGGEKSAALKNDDGWDTAINDPATIANTDDWGSTAISTTNEEWAEIEKDTAKLSLKEKSDFKITLNVS